MKSRRRATRAAAVLAAAGLSAGALAGSAQAAPVEHDGRVLSKESNGARSFTIRDDETGNRVRYRVNGRTRFERIPGGFRGLERGLFVSADGRRNENGRIVATEVEVDR